jgi:phosphatidylglycerophosphatase C
VTPTFPQPRADAPLVVFDFDHTLYDGDSGSHLFAWLIRRDWWRIALALLVTPVCAPMVAFLPTRRHGISVFVWIGSIGLRDASDFNAMIDRYVATHGGQIRQRLLPPALHVLRRHRAAGDRVLVATGAPPELARAMLAFAAHEDLPVIGSIVGPRWGGMGPRRHCHAEMKMTMIREAGHGDIAIAYSDSSADLPLLKAAKHPVVVNPKASNIAMMRRALPCGTPFLNWGCASRAGDAAGSAT